MANETNRTGISNSEQQLVSAGDILDILCETAVRMMFFVDTDQQNKTRAFADFSGGIYTLEAFQAVAAETCTIASEVLQAIGGLPLKFMDEKKQEVSLATGYMIDAYSPEDDTWYITATQTGLPPMQNLPYLSVVATTAELREAHHDALEAAESEIGYFEPPHPRSP